MAAKSDGVAPPLISIKRIKQQLGRLFGVVLPPADTQQLLHCFRIPCTPSELSRAAIRVDRRGVSTSIGALNH